MVLSEETEAERCLGISFSSSGSGASNAGDIGEKTGGFLLGENRNPGAPTGLSRFLFLSSEPMDEFEGDDDPANLSDCSVLEESVLAIDREGDEGFELDFASRFGCDRDGGVREISARSSLFSFSEHLDAREPSDIPMSSSLCILFSLS